LAILGVLFFIFLFVFILNVLVGLLNAYFVGKIKDKPVLWLIGVILGTSLLVSLPFAFALPDLLIFFAFVLFLPQLLAFAEVYYRHHEDSYLWQSLASGGGGVAFTLLLFLILQFVLGYTIVGI